MSSLLRPGEDLEDLIGSGCRIIQSQRGYRYSLDAVLLAHFACAFPGRSALELGMGNGAVSLLLAQKREDLQIVGIEIQEVLASQAKRSVIINGLEGRIRILMADWRSAPCLFSPRSFDLVLANPPYRAVGTGRLSPKPEVALAKHCPPGSLEDMVRASSWVLKSKGTFALIYHCSGLGRLMVSLCRANLEPKYLRLVHSHRESDAEFVLMAARREGRSNLKVFPPLILYSGKEDSRPSPELEAIYGFFAAPKPHEGKAS